MSAYRSVHKGTIEFDGQQVGYQLKRLSVAEAKEFRKLDEAGMESFIRERLAHLDTINDADGEPVPLDTIFTDFYFASLVNQLSGLLFQTGYIPRDKVDPSEGRSSAGSPGELSLRG